MFRSKPDVILPERKTWVHRSHKGGYVFIYESRYTGRLYDTALTLTRNDALRLSWELLRAALSPRETTEPVPYKPLRVRDRHSSIGMTCPVIPPGYRLIKMDNLGYVLRPDKDLTYLSDKEKQ